MYVIGIEMKKEHKISLHLKLLFFLKKIKTKEQHIEIKGKINIPTSIDTIGTCHRLQRFFLFETNYKRQSFL
jgi:hypothetical protein